MNPRTAAVTSPWWYVRTYHVGEQREDCKKTLRAILELTKTVAQSITEALIAYFVSADIDLSKMTLICTDGASIMLGKKNSVAARLHVTTVSATLLGCTVFATERLWLSKMLCL